MSSRIQVYLIACSFPAQWISTAHPVRWFEWVAYIITKETSPCYTPVLISNKMGVLKITTRVLEITKA
jgi:hypothetical protein